jgi:BirA family transcriptional regulator, biotin operon repressor / biotin---[acetyl-CoA-carboxylase] ligase
MSHAHFAGAWPAVRFDEIDSTNEEARRRTQSGDLGPCWLTARRQSAGRGRLGRQWDSPEGNLFATALFAYPRSPAEAALACFSAGLAVLDAVKAVGVDTSTLGLKWPNDLEAASAKLAGVLIETGAARGVLWMAAGFGINVTTAPARADRKTQCLANLPGGASLTADRLLGALDIAFRARLTHLLDQGFEPTRLDWLGHAAHLNKRVGLSTHTGRVEGVMIGLASDGALEVRLDSGAVTHVRAGEISILG